MSAAEAVETDAVGAEAVKAEDVSAWYGNKLAIRNVSLAVKPGTITALIGPSGCGKSTFLRTINRLHEVIPGARVGGDVFVGDQNVYGPGIDPVKVRAHIGMVFQRPTPFPTMSIYDNVAAGPKLNRTVRGAARRDALVEHSLRQAALWDEVKDRLRDPATALSGGQQQRLCIARALAMKPSVILLDEPTSALDPIAAAKVEDLLCWLKQNYTVIIVTHNMQQAARLADDTAFMLAGSGAVGELIEYGPTHQIFNHPTDKRTEDYTSGRFG